jgi:hypothetical protein
VHHVDAGQRGLGLRAVAPRGWRSGGRRRRRRLGSLLRRGAEEGALALGQKFLEGLELALGRAGVLATELAQLTRERGELGVQPIVLPLVRIPAIVIAQSGGS